ncbi:MAG: DinB family protein [Chloroflexi bacterium]|nr:DinB family protein [Chloroflexota bacterium]
MNTLQTHIAQPLRGYVAPLAMALWQLEDARMRTLRWLTTLDPAVVDWSPPGEQVNTIGTLLYHIAAIELDWVFADILKAPWPKDLDRWFPVEVRDTSDRLSAISGETVETHIERLALVRAGVLEGLREMTEADFNTPRVTPNYIVTPAWALHHLCQHEAEHRAEMSSLAARAPK